LLCGAATPFSDAADEITPRSLLSQAQANRFRLAGEVLSSF